MNIREGMRIKTIGSVWGTITKAEMQSCNGEVWYRLRIKPDDIDITDKYIEYHGLEKDMYKYFESVDGESLQVVSMNDFKALQEQVARLTKEVRTLRHRLDEVEVNML